MPRTQDCDGDAPKSKAPSGAVLCENTSVHKDEVKIVQFSPNCDYIVTASSDGVQAVSRGSRVCAAIPESVA